MSEEVKEKKHEIVIIEKNCKGCEICVEFCPTKTLGMYMGKCVVVDLDKCIGCKMCEIRCPDFAIFVDNPYAENFKKNK